MPAWVGGSVIIGGHKKKTEKVLTYLRRMYMPLKNYMDLEPEMLAGYWSQNKDVLGVTHFGELLPETVWLSPAYETRLQELIDLRIAYKLGKYKGDTLQPDIKQRILKIKESLRMELEAELRARLVALRHYLRSPARDPHLSLQEIYRHKPGRTSEIADTFMHIVKRLTQRKSSEEQNPPPEY